MRVSPSSSVTRPKARCEAFASVLFHLGREWPDLRLQFAVDAARFKTAMVDDDIETGARQMAGRYPELVRVSYR
jgi:hypothetical protein